MYEYIRFVLVYICETAPVHAIQTDCECCAHWLPKPSKYIHKGCSSNINSYAEASKREHLLRSLTSVFGCACVYADTYPKYVHSRCGACRYLYILYCQTVMSALRTIVRAHYGSSNPSMKPVNHTKHRQQPPPRAWP